MADLATTIVSAKEVAQGFERVVDSYATRYVPLQPDQIEELTDLPLTLGCATVVCE